MTAPPRREDSPLTTGRTDGSAGIVVSPHNLASRVGVDILATGGNAVDASIAVNAVLGVVAPDTCGLGGDLFALVHVQGEEKPTSLNASGMAGSGMSASKIRDNGLGAIPRRGHLSITIPGCVDGWEALISRHGELDLRTVLEPAIEIARRGFPVSDELSFSLGKIKGLVGNQSSSTPLYPEGAPAQPGVEITRPGLADTLEAIAHDGRNAFYKGEVGEGITEATSGAITNNDLDAVQSEWVEPLGGEVFGRTVWTIPPNSQGYILPSSLRIFEMLDPPDDPNDPLYQHLLIEAYRSVAWEREDVAVDPEHSSMTGDELLSEDRLSQIAATIRRDRAGRWPNPPSAPHGTAFMTVRDSSGMGVSLIQSNFWGIGSGLSAGSTGVFLHNRGAGFNLIPGHRNEYQPFKRPLHTLSPTLWTDEGRLDLLLGTRGGDQQPQFLAQYGASFYHAENCSDDSQALPRWSMEQPSPGADSVLRYESRVAPSTLEGLSKFGHTVTLASSHEAGWGPVSAIDTSREMKGSADPRISTSAAHLYRDDNNAADVGVGYEPAHER